MSDQRPREDYQVRWVTQDRLDAASTQMRRYIDNKINGLTLFMAIFLVVIIALGIILRDGVISGVEINMLEMKNETREYINQSNMAMMKQFWEFKKESDTMHWKEFVKLENRILELEQDKAQRAKRLNKSAEELV